MSAIEAFVLGLIQGLTEFLPVSSSGHLFIAKELFGIETENMAFEVIVHTATVLSTIIVFRKPIWDLLKGLFKFQYNAQTKYICMILVSMVPVFIVGVFFKDQVESIFSSGLLIVGLALVVTAMLLFISDRISRRRIAPDKPVGFRDAIIIGVAQAIAVIPGLSRSGATISTGLLCGVKKEEVAQFSFLMVLVPVLGEAFLELVGGDFSSASSGIGALPMIVGFLSAFVAGLFACKVMIALVKKASLKWFSLYCAIVGLACIIWNICK